MTQPVEKQSDKYPVKPPKPSQEKQGAIPLICLSCGTSNPVNARVCAKCGTALIVPDSNFNLKVELAARTDVGKVREHNEDDLNLWAIDGIYLALIADGMGGAAAGEEASRLTVETVQRDFLGAVKKGDLLSSATEEQLRGRLTQALTDANNVVVHKSQTDSAFKGMGTTSTLALVRGNRVFVGHVGDSRLYFIDGRREEITQITTDHSFVSALLASGHITPEQARHHPMTNVLFRAIGHASSLEVDLYEKYIKAGDRLVVCSDGLSKHVEMDEVKSIVLSAHDADNAARQLIDLANQRGGEDNISVIVMLIEAAEQESDGSLLILI